jgi:hypothetical protein
MRFLGKKRKKKSEQLQNVLRDDKRRSKDKRLEVNKPDDVHVASEETPPEPSDSKPGLRKKIRQQCAQLNIFPENAPVR